MLLLAKGQEVTREDVHNAWVAWMLERGETHESMVPFAELSAETQAEDSPYMVAVRTVARQHGAEAGPGSPVPPKLSVAACSLRPRSAEDGWR